MTYSERASLAGDTRAFYGLRHEDIDDEADIKIALHQELQEIKRMSYN